LENSMTAAPEPMRQFVANLNRLIAERGLTAAELAARADIHRSHLTLILGGERMVQLDTLVKLAGALGVSPAELLADVSWVSDGRAAASSAPAVARASRSAARRAGSSAGLLRALRVDFDDFAGIGDFGVRQLGADLGDEGAAGATPLASSP